MNTETMTAAEANKLLDTALPLLPTASEEAFLFGLRVGEGHAISKLLELLQEVAIALSNAEREVFSMRKDAGWTNKEQFEPSETLKKLME